MKILQQDNIGSHYRAAIYRMMDRELGCDFCFGDKVEDIKKMDYSLLKHKVIEVRNLSLKRGFYYQSGVLRLLSEDYEVYIFIGETRCISTWLFCLIARLFHPRKKVFFWSHGWYGKETEIERIIKKIYFKLPNGGTFLYGQRARDLMIKEGFDPSKLYVIHNSLDYDTQLAVRESMRPNPVYRNHFGNDKKNIVFIGRLTSVKRLDLLLDAIFLLKQKGFVVNTTFIGDGIEKIRLEQKAAVLDIIDQVWFYGPCYDEHTNAELIYNADVCVSPGNIGLTAMHVMMFGCPAITNNDFNHQMPEFEAIQDGKTGTFFESGDSKSLAEAISRWFVQNAKDRELIRHNCYAEIDNGWNPHKQIELIKRVIGF